MDVPVNYLAVLLAAVASMVVGFLWYGPMLFAKPWMKEMGYTEKSVKDNQQAMSKMYMLSFLVSLFTAYVLSHASVFSSAYLNNPLRTATISTAFWSWAGFVMPVQMTEVIFGGKSWKLFQINTGYQLASLLAMGLILGMMS